MINITNVQHARALINIVGDNYQRKVIDKLQSVSANYCSGDEKKTETVIANMEHEYALNVANVLWSDKYDEIPDWLKKAIEDVR